MADRGLLAGAELAGRWLELRRRLLRVPGVQAAAVAGGEVVWQAASGWADVDAGTAMTPRHLFRIASHSKSVTATLVLQLVEQGRLRLDDRLRAHLPWLVGPLGERTLRETLGHGAGFPRDGDDADHWLLHRPFPDRAGLQRLIVQAEPVLEPNERFKYSNVGYAALGQVLEAVTGEAYADLVRARIAGPLGLDDTDADLIPERAGDYAVGYSGLAHDDRRIPIENVPTAAMAPATGVSSTAADTARFFAAHRYGDPRLLDDASKRLAQRDEWEVERADERYGLGFMVMPVVDRRMVGHAGGFPGYATRCMVDPRDGLTVAVFTNAIDAPATEWFRGVTRLLDLAARAGPPDPALAGYAGAFGNLWQRLDVAVLGTRVYGLDLTAADPADRPLELTPVSPDALRVTGGGTGFGAHGELLRYTRDGSGSVTRVRLPGGMSAWPVERMPQPRDRVRLGDR